MGSDEDKKADYDRKLRKGKPSLAQSMWGAELPADVRGCFVDETKCSRCYQCCDLASSTFDIHTKKEREEKAYVKTQYGDAVWLVYEAVKQCPTQTIRMVSRENMPLIEYAMKQEKKKKTADADDEATASSMPGMHRAELKHAVFEMLDEDGDGRLYSPELRALAERFGFTGSDADWTREYSALCADLGCMPTDGPNLRMFSSMVDDEEACYLTDEEMVGMLNESLRLRRAGA